MRYWNAGVLTTKPKSKADAMLRACFASVVLVLVVGAALADPPIGSETTIAPAPDESRRIEEDDPGWDCCMTMGNRKCGPPAEVRR